MNDFTKEELEDLHCWGEVYTEFGQSWTYPLLKPLMDKIQSMIDNYCEHPESKRMVNCGKEYCVRCGSLLNE